MSNQRVTRSMVVNPPPAGEEVPVGHSRSSGGTDGDAASVTSTRRSRKSNRSSASTNASALRVQSTKEEVDLQKKLNDIQRSLQISELQLEQKRKEMKYLQAEVLQSADKESEDHKILVQRLQKVEEEEDELTTKVRLLKIDDTFATLDLVAAKRLSSVTEEHAQVVLGEESDHSQDLSDEDEVETNYEQARSHHSDESEYQRLNERLHRLRGFSPPPQRLHQTEVANPPRIPTEQSTTSPVVQQLVDVFSQAFGKVCKPVVSTPMTSTNPTNEKMLARQAMRMELSPFDGNSAEWPVFSQQYHNVTKACGLTDSENLQRLQKALKGDARECVQALLMSPENVGEIIRVLERRFGNPRLVVQRLVEKAQALSPVKEGDHGGLIHYVDVIRNLSTTANTMKCSQFLCNPQLLTQVVEKLPPGLQLEWGRIQAKLGKPFPDFKDLSSWLSDVADGAMQLYQPSSSSSLKKKPSEALRQPRPQKSFAATDNSKKKERKCRLCEAEHHHPSKCHKFLEMSSDEKWNWTKSQRLCFACLNFGHSVGDCRGKRACGIEGCDKQHHKLLHGKFQQEGTLEAGTTETLGHATTTGHINLNILPVQLKGPKGTVQTYAMLDPGATLTVLEASMADKLGLKGPIRPLTHSGLHEAVTVANSRTVSVTINGMSGGLYNLTGVRTAPALSLPRQSVRKSTLRRWSHLKNLPINTYEDKRPTILIGQDHAMLSNTTELVVGPPNAPLAGKTKLGWVLIGKVNTADEQSVSYHIREDTEDDLHQLVKHHFSIEAFGIKPNVEKPRSREDARAIKIMDESLTRVGDKWESTLLWKSDDPQLPASSKETAMRRLKSMEKKMDFDPVFAATYEEKITGYVEKGYARKLTAQEVDMPKQKSYFLPHFMALNPKKPNKLRFVFDAASKTGGVSLNDLLLTGPDLLKPLSAVIFKFRQRAVAITADVQDMFHRVGVKEEDQYSQQFLWRGKERQKEPETYVMQVLIFGATCSPSIALEAKNKNARLFTAKYPDTVEVIIDNFFMDDFLDSQDRVEGATQRMKDVQEIMGYGNFRMCKWLSNSEEFMKSVPEELRGTKPQSVELTDGVAVERILGLFWNPSLDVFTFSLSFLKMKDDFMSGNKLPTKRELLSLAMSIFDPIGLLSLFTIRSKMLLQDTWRTKIGWEDVIAESGKKKWLTWKDGLKKIPEFSVPRCYSTYFSSSTEVTLHVFVDASEQAYGAVAYFVINGPDGKQVSLVSAKARVAPLKPHSIPRLELMAAVVGARLSLFIRTEHSVTIHRVVFWSDSRTVLSWIQSDGRKFQAFVAHRVGELQELTNPSDWKWIPTKLNVADELTRDNEPCDFSPDSRWVNGPQFLLEDEDKWPQEKVAVPVDNNLEVKSEFLGHTKICDMKPLLKVENFSSWRRLIRVTARVLMCIRRLQKKNYNMCLGPEELAAAEVFWWKLVQQQSFPREMECTLNLLPLSKDSQLRRLRLKMDTHGVMRLDGRLENAGISADVKSPVLLDNKHPYTRLLIQHHHEASGHHGQEQLVNELRQKYYFPHLRSAVRSSWNRCQTCKNMRAVPTPPLMGQLPSVRLEAGVHPFTNTGVDYFGPMEVTVGRRHEKRWGVLFTCLSTRAVHLEIAASLSTDSCILAIRRFVGRRGNPKKMFSDNGTNFHGADNELKKALAELDQDKVNGFCSERSIEWSFIPPSAPHMGGSWERLVKSVKTALYATLKEQAPKEEVLMTVMIEAEHSVNGHPLTHVPIDPDDPEALTPNHFLIGRSSNVAPPGLFDAGDMCSRKLWRKSQQLANCFWSRWVKEYLPTLQRRTKWLQVTKPVEVGDVALEVDAAQPRNQWTIGRVTAVYPGSDGIVRVVDWKTKNGTYRRPVVKLAFLDIIRSEKPALEVD